MTLSWLVVPEAGGLVPALAIDACWDIHFLEGLCDLCSPRRRGAWAQFGFLGVGGCFTCGGPAARASSEPRGRRERKVWKGEIT